MPMNELEALLAKADAGTATEDELVRLGMLMAEMEADEPLPLAAAVRGEAGVAREADADHAELIAELERPFEVPLAAAVVVSAGRIDVSFAVMCALGAPMVDVAGAVRALAGPIDIADQVMIAIGAAPAVPVAEAVRAEAGTIEIAQTMDVSTALMAEAGTIDIADAVMAAIGGRSLQVADAVRAEAGTVDVAEPVMAAIGAESLQIGDLIRGEAGTIDIVDAVMAAIGAESFQIAESIRSEAGTIDIADAVMARIQTPVVANTAIPSSIGNAPAEYAPANRRFMWGALAVAAVALFAILAGNVVMNGSVGETGVAEVIPPVAPLVAPEDAPIELQFANADEIVIDDLQYGDDVDVQVIADGAAGVIIWVDEGETL